MATGSPDSSAASSSDTLADLWRNAVERHASRPLLRVDGDGSIFSYGEAGELVDVLAARLMGAGIRRGDRVCVVSPFHPEAAFVFWAATLIGAVLAPLDYRLSAAEIKDLCARIEPRILFCDRERAAVVPTSAVPVILFDDDDSAPMSGKPFDEWLQEGDDVDCCPEPPGRADPAALVFTSGTSGYAKGVVLSQAALCRSGKLMADTYDWRPDDVLLNLGDLHAMSGLRNPLTAVLHAGCSFVVSEASVRSNALLVCRCMAQHRVSLIGCVPAMLKQFISVSRRVETCSWESLRMVLCTGSTLPDAVAAAFAEQFGIPVMNYYGLTETTGLCAGVVPGMGGLPSGSIGIPLGCRISIVGEQGLPVAEGDTGELLICSDRLMIGYWRDQQLTDQVLRDGWFHTGDLVRLGDGGNLVLLDRRGDAHKDSRGEFIHPVEIERALERHPLVSEAGVCCFLGRDGGDRIMAFVVLSGSVAQWEYLETELRAFVAGLLGTQRTPTRILRLNELPRGSNGKLLRRKLKEICHEHG